MNEPAVLRLYRMAVIEESKQNVSGDENRGSTEAWGVVKDTLESENTHRAIREALTAGMIAQDEIAAVRGYSRVLRIVDDEFHRDRL